MLSTTQMADPLRTILVQPPIRARFRCSRHKEEHQKMNPKEQRIDFLMGSDYGNNRDLGNEEDL